ncbi:MAG: hypothetical protein C0609_11470 [Deltaproteobacteria bacterium]|nr:MAG: hypothetical protein C0609_11470 [Deltaproteobacteria bacterium]
MTDSIFDSGEIEKLAEIYSRAREGLGESTSTLDGWQRRVESLGDLGSRTFKIAVAGTVKSGKTTLVNTLLGDDLLKRGAGIVTSVVTRVRGNHTLDALIKLKGWGEINREASDAALFVGFVTDEGETFDLRSESMRGRLSEYISSLGEEFLGDDGTYEKHAALLLAMLDGYDRVASLITHDGGELTYSGDDFHRHKEFSGDDSMAVFVEDLSLRIPDFPLKGDTEIADCQGYDSPNPRHRERVQQYLIDSHLIVYVVSSRVGLRDADLRFLKDIERLGLIKQTLFVLNVDLSEYEAASEVEGARARLARELRPFIEVPEIIALSALRALLKKLDGAGAKLTKKERLLLALWDEEDALPSGGFDDFSGLLSVRVGERREDELAGLVRSTLSKAAEVLRLRLKNLQKFGGSRGEALEAGLDSMSDAREIIARSFKTFEGALTSRAQTIKTQTYSRVTGKFHPSGGSIANEVMAYVGTMKPSIASIDFSQKEKLFAKLAGVQQKVREEFHRYKVETINPMAVETIREIWGDVTEEMDAAAHDSASLVIEAVEGYRSLAMDLGIEVGEMELPELEASIGKKKVPLFSAVTVPAAEASAKHLISFASHWSVKMATGWAAKLLSKRDTDSGSDQLVSKGVETARELIAEEARSALLHYNEHVKYQLLGKNIDELLSSWIENYRETLDVLTGEVDSILNALDASREELSRRGPIIEELLSELDAAGY